MTCYLNFSSIITLGTFATELNKSFKRFIKIGLSSVTILGRLKSFKAPNNNKFSSLPSFYLFNFPAYLNTDLTALKPQS